MCNTLRGNYQDFFYINSTFARQTLKYLLRNSTRHFFEKFVVLALPLRQRHITKRVLKQESYLDDQDQAKEKMS
jgi:hypothetical protein